MNFQSLNPFTNEVINSYSYIETHQLQEVIMTLDASFQKFSLLKPVERQSILSKLPQRFQQRSRELALMMTQEMGKPIKESTLEVRKCISTIEKAIHSDLSFLNDREISTIYKKSVIKHSAMGVVFSIMPWNFPVWQVIRMAIPALISGNTVLLKHSEITPGVAKILEELFSEIWDSPIFLNAYIHHQDTEKVLSDPAVVGFALTGSVEAGRTVYQIASRHLKKAVLELGGSDPYIVTGKADVSLAAKKIAKGRLNNCGQVCIAVKRVIVHESIYSPFLESLKLEMSGLRFGDPCDPKTDIGPLAHSRFKETLSSQLLDLKKQTKARLLFKIEHLQSEKSNFADIEVYELTENFDYLKNKEFFAPILIVTPYHDEAKALELANATDFGLGAGVFSSDIQEAQKLAHSLIAGQVAINDLVSTDLDLPFGGFKNSGLGRELGQEGYLEFTQTKVVSCS